MYLFGVGVLVGGGLYGDVVWGIVMGDGSGGVIWGCGGVYGLVEVWEEVDLGLYGSCWLICGGLVKGEVVL